MKIVLRDDDYYYSALVGVDALVFLRGNVLVLLIGGMIVMFVVDRDDVLAVVVAAVESECAVDHYFDYPPQTPASTPSASAADVKSTNSLTQKLSLTVDVVGIDVRSVVIAVVAVDVGSHGGVVVGVFGGRVVLLIEVVVMLRLRWM